MISKPGEDSLIGALVSGSSYQQPRRGSGRERKQRSTGNTGGFTNAVWVVLFVNVSSEFND